MGQFEICLSNMIDETRVGLKCVAMYAVLWLNKNQDKIDI